MKTTDKLEFGEGIRIVQVANEFDLEAITELDVTPGTFQRLINMHFEVLEEDRCKPGVCWIDSFDADGMTTSDPSLAWSDETTMWLVKEFFKIPKVDWGKIKTPEQLERRTKREAMKEAKNASVGA